MSRGGAVETDQLLRLHAAVLRLARQLRRVPLEGLTQSQLSALGTIVREGPLALGDLAAVEGITPATLSPVVASLEQRGLVRRETDPDDARRALVAGTATGRRLRDDARARSARLLIERAQLLASESPGLFAALLAAVPAIEEIGHSDWKPAVAQPLSRLDATRDHP